MKIKKFNQFINESSSIEMKDEWSSLIRETPELSNLISNRKIELKDGKLFYDESDEDTTEILKSYLGIS